MKQLPLNIHLRDSATFENFYAGKNALLLTYLEEFLDSKRLDFGQGAASESNRNVSQLYQDCEPSGNTAQNSSEKSIESRVYLFGMPGTGRSHLLQAACSQANMQGYTAVYLPLREAASLSPAMLEGLDGIDLVCIDDIQMIAGQTEWQEALFHFYNRSEVAQNQFLITGNSVPDRLGLTLPDLVSRLNACIRFQVQPLNDDEKRAALQQRAHARGLMLSIEVGDFLLNHYSRDMSTLFRMLEALDKASLVAQRKLTIPFVKTVLGEIT